MVDVVESLQRDCRHVAYDYGALLPPDVPLSPRLTRSIPHGATAAQRGRIRPRRSLEYAYRLDHILEAPLAPSTRPCMYGGLRIHDSAGVPTDVFTGAGEKIVEYRAGANAVRYMPCTQPRCVDRRVCLPCISAHMRQSTGLTSRLHMVFTWPPVPQESRRNEASSFRARLHLLGTASISSTAMPKRPRA